MNDLKEKILQTIENTLSDTSIEKDVLLSSIKHIFEEFESEEVVLFQVGDTVKDKDLPFNGVIVDIAEIDYPIIADMREYGFLTYTKDGKYLLGDKEPSLIKI